MEEGKLRRRREIHGIDQAVSVVMHTLDRVFGGRVKGWCCACNGFQVEVLKESADTTLVRISPIGLPESESIECKFLHFPTDGLWAPYEVFIPYAHGAGELRGQKFEGNTFLSRFGKLSCLLKNPGHDPLLESILSREQTGSTIERIETVLVRQVERSMR